MHTLPFEKPGRFFRGNIHCHSTGSDGTLDPEEVVAAYRNQGYDFLAITDHFWQYDGKGVTDTRFLRTPDFTTLLGAELHGPGQVNGALWHIVALGLPPDFAAPAPEETGPALATRAAAAGAFIGIAHPHWSGLTYEDIETLDVAHALEVINATCALKWDHGNSWYVSDECSVTGRHLTTYAADDAHFVTQTDCFGAWVQVRAETFTPEVLLASLKAGHYYSSEGPEIQYIGIEDNSIAITVPTDCSICVTGPHSGGPFHSTDAPTTATASKIHGQQGIVHHSDNGFVTVTFPLDTLIGPYCRVTITNATGKRAWSNPIWLA